MIAHGPAGRGRRGLAPGVIASSVRVTVTVPGGPITVRRPGRRRPGRTRCGPGTPGPGAASPGPAAASHRGGDSTLSLSEAVCHWHWH